MLRNQSLHDMTVFKPDYFSDREFNRLNNKIKCFKKNLEAKMKELEISLAGEIDRVQSDIQETRDDLPVDVDFNF